MNLTKLIWIAPLLGAILGGIELLALGGAESAPQQAAGAAMACGYAVVPYVLARAIQALADAENHQRQMDLLAKIADGIGKPAVISET